MQEVAVLRHLRKILHQDVVVESVPAAEEDAAQQAVVAVVEGDNYHGIVQLECCPLDAYQLKHRLAVGVTDSAFEEKQPCCASVMLRGIGSLHLH